MFTLHIVRAWRQHAEGRPAQHQLGGTETDQVGEIRGSVGKLSHFERATQVGGLWRQLLAQIAFHTRPVQALAGAHRCYFR